MNHNRKLRALIHFFSTIMLRDKINPIWLGRTKTMVDARFSNSYNLDWEPHREGQVVTINGTHFLWPASSSVLYAEEFISEAVMPNHPHRYNFGITPIDKGDIVLDVGACEGYFSLLTSLVGATPIAIEPSKSMTRILEQNFVLNDLDRPLTINALIGLEEKVVRFHDDSACPGKSKIDPEGEIEVPMTSIDKLVERSAIDTIDFIKADCEGADFDVLQSAEETIRRCKPKIAFTTYHSDDHFSLMKNWLLDRGYRVCGKGVLFCHDHFRVLMLHAVHPDRPG